MKRWIIFMGLLFSVVFMTNAKAFDMVSFEGQGIGDKRVRVTGRLEKPEGDGPFPAVVLLHGTRGISSRSQRTRFAPWLEKLNRWGYVTLMVDSFSSRGYKNIVDNVFSVHAYERMLDAFAGKSYLTGQSFVDDKRIALMGWSHGGWTTLYAVSQTNLIKIQSAPFKAAIAFYPWCGRTPIHLNAPLMILIGEKDKWMPAADCRNLEFAHEPACRPALKIYPDAGHGFDVEVQDTEVDGYTIQYDPAAAGDAVVQVGNFLATHLR